MQMSKTQWGYITQAVHTRAHLVYINTQLIFKGELAAYVTEQIYSFSAMFLFFPLSFYESFPEKSK